MQQFQEAKCGMNKNALVWANVPNVSIEEITPVLKHWTEGNRH